jgi:hypothetical protein
VKLRTSGWALIIACRRVLCGSSVYVHRKWSSSLAGTGGTVLFVATKVGAGPLFVDFAGGRVAVATEDRILNITVVGDTESFLDGKCKYLEVSRRALIGGLQLRHR